MPWQRHSAQQHTAGPQHPGKFPGGAGSKDIQNQIAAFGQNRQAEGTGHHRLLGKRAAGNRLGGIPRNINGCNVRRLAGLGQRLRNALGVIALAAAGIQHGAGRRGVLHSQFGQTAAQRLVKALLYGTTFLMHGTEKENGNSFYIRVRQILRRELDK